MIASLKGLISLKSPTTLTIEVQGIGYQVFTPLSTYYKLPDEKNPVFLHIYTHVREDAIQLFGFSSLREKELFLLLLGVSGVGPKLALNILSGIVTHELVNALQEGQIHRLRAIPGVGPKMAGRLILELKDKAMQFEVDGAAPSESVSDGDDAIQKDVLSALINLGYNRMDAKRAINRVLKEGGNTDSVESLIKEGLRQLSKSK